MTSLARFEFDSRQTHVLNWVSRGPLAAVAAMSMCCGFSPSFGFARWVVPGWFALDIQRWLSAPMNDPQTLWASP